MLAWNITATEFQHEDHTKSNQTCCEGVENVIIASLRQEHKAKVGLFNRNIYSIIVVGSEWMFFENVSNTSMASDCIYSHIFCQFDEFLGWGEASEPTTNICCSHCRSEQYKKNIRKCLTHWIPRTYSIAHRNSLIHNDLCRYSHTRCMAEISLLHIRLCRSAITQLGW